MMVKTLLYNMTDSPLPLVVDMYEKILVPSITKESKRIYKKIIAPLEYCPSAWNIDKCNPVIDWKYVDNYLDLHRGYLHIFEEDFDKALYVAYKALSIVFQKYPDFQARQMHMFNYMDEVFLFLFHYDKVIFVTLEEWSDLRMTQEFVEDPYFDNPY